MALDGHVIDLIPALALNCLDEAEVALVSEHLKRCQECREELRAYQAVVDQLPLAVPQADPSPQIKQALLERVGKDRIHAAAAFRMGAAVECFQKRLSRLGTGKPGGCSNLARQQPGALAAGKSAPLEPGGNCVARGQPGWHAVLTGRQRLDHHEQERRIRHPGGRPPGGSLP